MIKEDELEILHKEIGTAELCSKLIVENGPDFPVPSWLMIRCWLNEGWNFRFPDNKFMQDDPAKYISRVEYEMERIIPRGFDDYFCMLSDAVRFAKDQKIPVGPARGSAAASLVCYLLRITEVDPLQFPHMLFERFIDPKRLDLPDVDLDFADDRRDEVRQHLVRRYGSDRVGNIGNFTRYRGKNSIDDVARVYEIPEWETRTIKDLIIERSGGDSRISDSLQDTFEAFPKAAEVLDRYPALKYASRLEGNYRGLGVHAAGLVLSNEPITETCAVYTRSSAGREVTVVAYDKKDAEYLGMLKADFLGLSTMGMIGIALDIIGMDLEDLYRVPLDEPATLAAFKRNDVTGIFQFEGRATRLVCGDVSPDNFQHLADINALSRPGPLFSGMTAQYVEVRHGRAEPEKLHPIVDEQTEWTYGQIVYQEQVLTIIRDLGGFPVQRVGDIRKIISQKLGEASFQAMYDEFRDGAYRLHGVNEELALKIWRFMVTSATYSFCVTGDTVLEKAGKGRYSAEEGDELVTVAELYRQQHDRTNIPMSDKIRAGRLKILGMDDDGRIRPNSLLKIHDPVPYKCTKITTNTGRTVTVSNDHQMLAVDGYRHTLELEVGMEVVVAGDKDDRENERSSEGLLRQKNKGHILRSAEVEVRQRDKMRCNHCGMKDDGNAHTLELAHILTLTDHDGDYEKYNSASNMMLLCNSCHKKFDYRIQGTRVKRWSRGRPTRIETIVSLEDAGVQEVYDISMAGPSHNYQGNGFIHHNNIAHCLSGDTMVTIGAGSNKAHTNYNPTFSLKELWDRWYGLPEMEAWAPGYRGRYAKKFSGPCMRCGENSSVYSKGWCPRCRRWRSAVQKRGIKILALAPDGRIRPRNVTDIHHMGHKDVYRVTLRNGSEVKATEDHRFLTVSGWKELRHLAIGNKVITSGKHNGSLHGVAAGSPSGISDIVSIEFVGEEEVFDLTMEDWGDEPNFLANGMVVHNCVSYSMLAFWQMWIKIHHPTAFYAAQLTKVGDGKDQKVKRSKLMTDALRHGQKISPPDIRLSGSAWAADVPNSRVIAGFQQIDGIGEKTAEAIIASKEGTVCPQCLHGVHHDVCGEEFAWGDKTRVCKCAQTVPVDLNDWSDLRQIKGIGDKTIERIEDFCAVDDPFGLELVGKILRKYRRLLRKGGPDWIGVPRPTHTSSTIPTSGVHEVVWMGIPRAKNYQDYVENQRSRTGREVDEIIANMKDPHLVKSCVVQSYDDQDEDVYVRFNRWTFPRYEKALEDLALDHDIIIIKGLKREDFGVSLHVKEMIVIDPSEDM